MFVAIRFAALVLLVGIGPQVVAQNSTEPGQSPDCLPRASRVRDNCESAKVVARTEHEVTFTLELPPPKTLQCATTTEIEYTRRDTLVNVAGTIQNKDCAASDGEYKLTVSVRASQSRCTCADPPVE